jgi:hypothetical protein
MSTIIRVNASIIIDTSFTIIVISPIVIVTMEYVFALTSGNAVTRYEEI